MKISDYSYIFARTKNQIEISDQNFSVNKKIKFLGITIFLGSRKRKKIYIYNDVYPTVYFLCVLLKCFSYKVAIVSEGYALIRETPKNVSSKNRFVRRLMSRKFYGDHIGSAKFVEEYWLDPSFNAPSWIPKRKIKFLPRSSCKNVPYSFAEHIYFIGQIPSELGIAPEKYSTLLRSLNDKYGEQFIYLVHPRDTPSRYDDINIASIDSNTDFINKLMISINSTVLFLIDGPKIISLADYFRFVPKDESLETLSFTSFPKNFDELTKEIDKALERG